MTSMDILKVSNLSYSYSDTNKKILNKLNLVVKKGEIISIVGKSGCGKSTFLLTLNNIIPKILKGSLSGNIKLFNEDIKNREVSDLAKLVQIMFQNPEEQFFSFSVIDELSFGLKNIGFSDLEIKNKINEIVSLFNIKHLLERGVDELSSGEKQLIILASLIIMKPNILVLDEPTANLDPYQTKRLGLLLKKINKVYGTTIIIVEHDLDFIKISTRILYFDKGKLIPYNNNLFKKYPSFLKNNPKDQVILDIKNISYFYTKNNFVFNNLNLKIYKNEILGIIGPNGCGKSTFLKNIIGILKPKTGDILYNNTSIINKKISEISMHIGYVFQNPDYTLFENSVKDEIKFGANNLNIRFNSKIISDLGLSKILNQDTSNLSLGQKRLVNIATTLGMNPDILIIDEPDTGLDRLSSIKLCQTLKKINKSNKTIIIVSHNLNFIHSICDRVIKFENSKINIIK